MKLLPRFYVRSAKAHFTKAPFVTSDPAAMDRVSWVAADFFADDNGDSTAGEPNTCCQAIPEADLFVMTRILHDWCVRC